MTNKEKVAAKKELAESIAKFLKLANSQPYTTDAQQALSLGLPRHTLVTLKSILSDIRGE